MELHEHLGRRYRFTAHSAPDITVVSIDPTSCRVHALSGQRQNIPTPLFLRAVYHGALEEALAPPFVLPRSSRFDRARAARQARLRARTP